MMVGAIALDPAASFKLQRPAPPAEIATNKRNEELRLPLRTASQPSPGE
jgi:hypothetical protein